MTTTFQTYDDFFISKRSHWESLQSIAVDLFGSQVDIDSVPLKRYQDLFAVKFILDNLPPGSRLLEIGGADSRVLSYLSSDYECWNVDKLEGLGNGPKSIGDVNFKLVRDYIGSFNSELKDDYFDLVFSISVLEHITDSDLNLPIMEDIQRVLSPGGFSLQLFDINFISDSRIWTNSLANEMVRQFMPALEISDLIKFYEDPDLYYMSESAYNQFWFPHMKICYQDYGRPSCLNVIWQK